MAKASLGKEIVVTVKNKVGALADISEILYDARINMLAVLGVGMGTQAKINLLTKDNSAAVRLLKQSGYKSAKLEDAVILGLENRPGAMMKATARLAANSVNIKYIYGSACGLGCTAIIVLSTNNNRKAIAALNK